MKRSIFDSKYSVLLVLVILVSIGASQFVLTYHILPSYDIGEPTTRYVTYGMLGLLGAAGLTLCLLQRKRFKYVGKCMDEDAKRLRRQAHEIAQLPPHEYLKERELLKQKLHDFKEKYLPDEDPETSKD